MNMDKSKLVPCQELEFIGKIWNTLIGEVRNVDSKVKSTVRECNFVFQKGTSYIEELWKLLGKIEWLARTMPLSRCWKRSLILELNLKIQQLSIMDFDFNFRVGVMVCKGRLFRV